LGARDRQRKPIAKIDAALTRIEDGTCGYCEETGEPNSRKRLEARPIAHRHRAYEQLVEQAEREARPGTTEACVIPTLRLRREGG
jgi:DnaK suppressor protein